MRVITTGRELAGSRPRDIVRDQRLDKPHDRQKVATRDAWAKLTKFKGVDAARLRWLTEVEAKRLMNAAPPDGWHRQATDVHTACRSIHKSWALRVGCLDTRSGIEIRPRVEGA